MLVAFIIFAVNCFIGLYFLPERWKIPIFVSEIIALIQLPAEVRVIGLVLVGLQFLALRMRGTSKSSLVSRSLLVRALEKNPIATVFAIAGKSERGALVALSSVMPEMLSFEPNLRALLQTNPVGEMRKLIDQSGDLRDSLSAVFDMGREDINQVVAVMMEVLAAQGRKVNLALSAFMAACLFLFVMIPVPFLAMLRLSALLR